MEDIVLFVSLKVFHKGSFEITLTVFLFNRKKGNAPNVENVKNV